MSIEITFGEEKPKTMRVRSMPVGHAFAGRVGDTSGVFLVTFEHRLVNLNSPNQTWTATNSLEAEVDEYLGRIRVRHENE